MLDFITNELIANLCKKKTKKAYTQIRQILLDYIKTNPGDISVRLKLIKHVYSTEPIDILDILDYINEIFQYDPNNIYALLYLAYIQTFDFGGINEILINKLKSYTNNDDEIMAMVAIAISWYYEKLMQFDDQEKWLKNSLKYSSLIVRNYYELILFYFYKGKSDLARQLIPLALHNIKHVFLKKDDLYLIDTTNVEDFFNIRYKKIHVSQDFIDDLLSWQSEEIEPR